MPGAGSRPCEPFPVAKRRTPRPAPPRPWRVRVREWGQDRSKRHLLSRSPNPSQDFPVPVKDGVLSFTGSARDVLHRAWDEVVPPASGFHPSSVVQSPADLGLPVGFMFVWCLSGP